MKVFLFQVSVTVVTVLLLSNVILTKETEESKAVVLGNGQFAKNIYTALAKKKGNIFYSPVSIHAVLSLLYQGAKGSSETVLEKVLNVPDPAKTAIGYKNALDALNAIENVTLLMANKVFLNKQYKLQEGFRNVAVQNFNSEVEILDFKKTTAAAESINTWVEKKTHNKIKEAIHPSDLQEDTSTVLVNAIYFKSQWAIPFKTENTTTEKFYISDDNTTDVEMMHLTDAFMYADSPDLDAQILRLYYANAGDVSMIVILPNKRNGIADLEKKLATVDLTTIGDNIFRKRPVNLALPKFKIEQSIDLKEPITELGAGDIFSEVNANLSGIIETSNPLYVSKAIHKSYIEVNEEGTEAAAFTGLAIIPVSSVYEEPPPVDFIANHPFVIIVRSRKLYSFKEGVFQAGDTVSNTLFVGRISEPSY